MDNTTDAIIAMARKNGQIRAGDLAEIGVQRTTLAYLAKKGLLRRIARGVYVPVDQISENETLRAACLTVPHGVVCLLSALQFHDITTQMPMETWIAIERDRTVPQTKNCSIRIVKLSSEYFKQGIQEHHIQGSVIRIYSPAKTVVDCFKYRNKIGVDVAREALKDSLSQGKSTVDEIYQYAMRCRMASVMRPYLEMV